MVAAIKVLVHDELNWNDGHYLWSLHDTIFSMEHRHQTYLEKWEDALPQLRPLANNGDFLYQKRFMQDNRLMGIWYGPNRHKKVYAKPQFLDGIGKSREAIVAHACDKYGDLSSVHQLMDWCCQIAYENIIWSAKPIHYEVYKPILLNIFQYPLVGLARGIWRTKNNIFNDNRTYASQTARNMIKGK